MSYLKSAVQLGDDLYIVLIPIDQSKISYDLQTSVLSHLEEFGGRCFHLSNRPEDISADGVIIFPIDEATQKDIGISGLTATIIEMLRCRFDGHLKSYETCIFKSNNWESPSFVVVNGAIVKTDDPKHIMDAIKDCGYVLCHINQYFRLPDGCYFANERQRKSLETQKGISVIDKQVILYDENYLEKRKKEESRLQRVKKMSSQRQMYLHVHVDPILQIVNSVLYQEFELRLARPRQNFECKLDALNSWVKLLLTLKISKKSLRSTILGKLKKSGWEELLSSLKTLKPSKRVSEKELNSYKKTVRALERATK